MESLSGGEVCTKMGTINEILDRSFHINEHFLLTHVSFHARNILGQ